MANINLAIPDNVISRVLDAFAAEFQYVRTQLPGETKAQFAKRMTGDWIKKIVKSQEGATAILPVRVATDSDVDTNIVIS